MQRWNISYKNKISGGWMKRDTEFSRTLCRTVRKERRRKPRRASKYIPQHRDPSSGDRELRSESKEIQKTGAREGKPGA